PANHLHLVILPHRHRPDVVLRPEIGRERCAHKDAAETRRRREVGFPVLPAGARNPCLPPPPSAPTSYFTCVFPNKHPFNPNTHSSPIPI
ncbi:hypothetical protein U1Q18_013059, partial [Sarracenia purpurea var. burkii]